MRKEPRLGEILVQAGVIDEFQLSAALEEHRRCGHRLGITLVRLGFLEENDLVRALAAQLQLPIVKLDGSIYETELAWQGGAVGDEGHQSPFPELLA